MVDGTREQLLGYLLGALEESERESVESQLAKDPQLRRQLARLRERLQPLWLAQPDYDPPPGLAARTCKLVACCARAVEQEESVAGTAGPAGSSLQGRSAAVPAAAGSYSYSGWLDWAMTAGLLVAVTLLIFPAIQNSRFNARLATCQDHLRRLGLALTQYSQKHQGFFPPVYDEGRLAGAGIYGPILLTHGFVDDSRWFICPASPLADQRQFRVPLLDELLTAAPGRQLARLQRQMGGSFGYSLGFFDGRIYTTRNLRRPHFAVMADAPSTFLAGYQSANHDGRGQNVLFEDGRIMFYTSSRPHARADDVFVNEVGMVAAGRNPNDSVIGASTAVPCLCGQENCPGRP